MMGKGSGSRPGLAVGPTNEERSLGCERPDEVEGLINCRHHHAALPPGLVQLAEEQQVLQILGLLEPLAGAVAQRARAVLVGLHVGPEGPGWALGEGPSTGLR